MTTTTGVLTGCTVAFLLPHNVVSLFEFVSLNVILIVMHMRWQEVFFPLLNWKEGKTLEMCMLLHPQRRFQPSSFLEEETMVGVGGLRPQSRLRNM